MVTGTAWYQMLVEQAPARASDPVASLLRAGVRLTPREDGSPPGAGVVFFDRVDARLLATLHDASRGGADRVLAVAMRGSDLASDASWLLLRHGAADVIAWEHSAEPQVEVAARLQRWTEVDRLVDSPLVRENLIGESPAWLAVLREVVEAARFTDAPVLILGETGTGKELVARLVHALDPRPRKRELVVLDCATLVPELAGSEFFGHERGAFTGAAGARDGAFARADGGTLFLDEVGDLPARLQAQLLRAVQERTYKRVGGNGWQKSDFRLVCATHRTLHDDVLAGAFRSDLYYRVAAVVCRVPALRDRVEDLVPLFRHFVARAAGMERLPELDEAVRDFLFLREYPGNVRDLKQLATRVAYRHVGPGPISVGDLPDDERPRDDRDADEREPDFAVAARRALARGAGLKEIGRLAADAAIRIAVGDAGGNLQLAAQRLHVTDRALQLRRAAEQRPPLDGTLPAPTGATLLS